MARIVTASTASKIITLPKIKVTGRPRFKAHNFFIPTEGNRACFHNEDEDHYGDVQVTHMYRGGKTAKVYYIKDVKKIPFIVNVDSLEAPLEPNIEERFTYFKELAELVLTKQLNSLYVYGNGGLGKSYTLQEVLDALEMEEDSDYIRVKGQTSPFALFRLFKENPDQTFVLDDFDSAFRTEASANILKAVLDTYDVRRVSWLTTTRGGDNSRQGQSFEFTGSVVFLSNLKRDMVPGSILSRSAMVDLYMTPAEIVERMHMVKNNMDVGQSLDVEERDAVIDLIDKYKYTIEDLNIRTLRKALKVYEKKKNMNLVRYQILNS